MTDDDETKKIIAPPISALAADWANRLDVDHVALWRGRKRLNMDMMRGIAALDLPKGDDDGIEAND